MQAGQSRICIQSTIDPCYISTPTLQQNVYLFYIALSIVILLLLIPKVFPYKTYRIAGIHRTPSC